MMALRVAPEPATPLLRRAIADAILAPSSHNTQPWRFRLHGDVISLYADWSRHLPVIDADGRQLVMSCGAALFNLRASIRAGGRRDMVELMPDPIDPALLARIWAGEVFEPASLDLRLAEAIPQRRTFRQPFAVRPVSTALADDLAVMAAREGAWMVRLVPAQKHAIATAVAEADRRQFAQPAYRRELARWLVPTGSHRRDGIPFERKEYGSASPLAIALRVRSKDLGADFGQRETELIRGAPVVVVLGTDRDDRDDWLACGQALEAVLLRATSIGLSASYLNQVLEVSDLRQQIAALVRPRGRPQLILRLGYGRPEPPTPRRPLAEVLTEA
jgi:nitroreductase